MELAQLQTCNHGVVGMINRFRTRYCRFFAITMTAQILLSMICVYPSLLATALTAVVVLFRTLSIGMGRIVVFCSLAISTSVCR
jgi:hypothetical protein